jgi:hypothetical protein
LFLCPDAGGVIALLYASKYHDVKTIVNLSGRYNLQAGIEERLGKDYLERIRKEGFIDVRSGKSFTQRLMIQKPSNSSFCFAFA